MSASLKHLRVRFVCLLLPVLLLAGCATGTDPRDPFEPFNRGVYQFNEVLDKALLKPVAEGYRFVLPQFVRASVSNFFSNLNDIVVALNNLLQGKFTAAYSDFGRIAINSTFGILGLFDIASEAGIEKHEEDFGQTLGRWGLGDGPYIVLPFFGPSNVRDTVGRVVDFTTDPATYVDPNHVRNIMWGTRIVSRRAELLDATTVLQTAALDPYEFIRDAYLQRRRTLVHDGSPPPDRDLIDAPPKQQSSTVRDPPFPSAGEPTGPGAILVSGESRVPVRSAYAEPSIVPAPPAASIRTAAASQRAIAITRDGTPLIAGEPLTALQVETLAPGQLTTTGAEPLPQHELPRLTELWRALKLKP